MARTSRKNRDAAPPRTALYVRTALYIRLSVEDNKNRGNSLEMQRVIMENHIALYPEFEVAGVYEDNGVTGTTFDRPSFLRMLADIEAGKIDCVMVKDLSRLGRNCIDAGYYIERYFPAHNVRFIAVGDRYDSADPDNRHGGLVLPLKNMVNEAYSKDIGRKIKSQALQSMKDGDFIGARAPYGYQKSPDNCHKLLIDPEAAAVVRQIFQWAHDKAALNEIVRRLNDAAVPPPSYYKKAKGEISHDNLMGNGKWQTRTVQKILTSEVYTGDLVQGKSKTIDHKQLPADQKDYIVVCGTHEPIISHELYDAVQEHRRQVAESSKKKAEIGIPYSPNLFKGKVFCSHCGVNLNRQRSHSVYWFRCTTINRISKDACTVVSIREKDLMDVVLPLLRREMETLMEDFSYLRQGDSVIKAEQAKTVSTIAKLRKELDKYHMLLQSLFENMMRGVLTDDEYHMMKLDYEAKVACINKKIEGLEQAQANLAVQMREYADLAKDALLVAGDPNLTGDLIQRLIDRIEVSHDRQVTVSFRFQSGFAKMCGVTGQCVNL